MIVDSPIPPWWILYLWEDPQWSPYLGWYYSEWLDIWFNQQDSHPIKIRANGEDFKWVLVLDPEDDYPYWTILCFKDFDFPFSTPVVIDSMSLTIRGIAHLIDDDDL